MLGRLPELASASGEAAIQATYDVKYAGYVARQQIDIARQQRLADQAQDDTDHDRRGDRPADGALIRLGGRDVGEEPMPAELAADEIGARVIRPHRADEDQQPAAIRPPAGEWRVRRQCAGQRPQLPDERELRDIQRAEHGGQPGVQSVGRIEPREGTDRGQHDPDRDDEERSVATKPSRGGCVQRDHSGDGYPERHHRRLARSREETECLDRRQRHHTGHRQGDPRGPGPHHHDQRRHEDDRACGPLAEQVGGWD